MPLLHCTLQVLLTGAKCSYQGGANMVSRLLSCWLIWLVALSSSLLEPHCAKLALSVWVGHAASLGRPQSL